LNQKCRGMLESSKAKGEKRGGGKIKVLWGTKGGGARGFRGGTVFSQKKGNGTGFLGGRRVYTKNRKGRKCKKEKHHETGLVSQGPGYFNRRAGIVPKGHRGGLTFGVVKALGSSNEAW